ncbi:roadblock/LC7 domain-containing protein [Demequina sp. NBRC 110053]|uniref:roadblock/LC7 domain-containing protein n=1 Tax=Demequina sp. NBRC 110053 TaxID=1570342 RepID=UPI000A015EE0|nr:roadblock/LC7 domain-containing protein [Demequina sp. NBRC 110053]
MIIPKHGLLVGARLRKDLTGLSRLIIARTDGIALYDDVPLRERDGGAALTAAMLGLAATATAAFGLGAARVSTTVGEDGVVVLAPVDAGHVLAILLDAGADVASAAEAVMREAERLRVLSGMARTA